jgi:hypothetical protein
MASWKPIINPAAIRPLTTFLDGMMSPSCEFGDPPRPSLFLCREPLRFRQRPTA